MPNSSREPEPSPAPEDLEEALLEGDRTFAPGSTRAAFSHRTFRTVYLGAFASNIGTWMQNVVLGALAYSLTRSGVFVGLIIAAQLGPLLVLSMVGGMLADAIDRKKLLIVLTVEQAAFSVALAAVVADPDPHRALLVGITLMVGIGNALYAPTFAAVVPILVPRRDLAGAISLNSVQMNASRVVGPAIGSLIYARYGASWVFLFNAASYLVIIWVLTRVSLPPPPASGSQGLHRILEGVRYARADPVVGRCIVTIFVFSLLCLPFITQMPKLAGDNLGIDSESITYGLLYASFGLGAVIGALSIGTTFASVDKARLTRVGLLGFALLIGTLALIRDAGAAFPIIFCVGAAYFAVITSLSTVLQQDLDDSVRGKVMALWIMGFGGTVPFGGLAGGWFADLTSVTTLMAISVLVAVLLAAWSNLRPPHPHDPSPLDIAT